MWWRIKESCWQVINTMLYLYYQKERKINNMDNKRLELASRICDCISDGYDDEELKKDAENDLYGELEQTTDFIAKVLERLCERIEDLEE